MSQMMLLLPLLLLLVGVLADVAAGQANSQYLIGTGIAEITGPASGVTMFGYVVFTQYSQGIHTRQYARTTIVGQGTKRVVIVNIDSGMQDAYIKQTVVSSLPSNLASFYNMDNILISGTHTHSAPGGFSQFFFYNLANFGFVQASAQALINGIVTSITRAHNNLQPGKLFINVGVVNNASINREPKAYSNNVDAGAYTTNVDKNMTLLKLVNSATNTPIGLVNWFAVHCTSLNSTNQLISGDNKGYAQQMYERSMDPTNAVLNPGNSQFVASFVQANEGDVSPNTQGGHCTDNGVPCDAQDNPVCGGRLTAQCVASGPGVDMFDSARIIGQTQMNVAQQLYNSATEVVSGPVNYISEFIDISNQPVTDPKGNNVTTCTAAIGLGFTAGTIDGAGLLPVIINTGNTSLVASLTAGLNSLWNPLYICNAQEVCLVPNLFQCQAPKTPIIPAGLLPNSGLGDWAPKLVQTQIFQIGSLIIVAVPGEFTTMSGRRVRNAVEQTIRANSPDPTLTLHIVIAGLSNTYASYTATYEEYQTLSYAGSQTAFGPNQLTAYINEFKSLATKMVLNQTPTPYTLPATPLLVPTLYPSVDFLPDCSACGLISLTPCGTPLVNPAATYSISSKATVSATFCAGSPSNNPMFETPFMTVENKTGPNAWTVIATDAFWETKFTWSSTSTQVTCTWQLPLAVNVTPGTYRIRHFGYNALLRLNLLGIPIVIPGFSPYTGVSSTFTLTP